MKNTFSFCALSVFCIIGRSIYYIYFLCVRQSVVYSEPILIVPVAEQKPIRAVL